MREVQLEDLLSGWVDSGLRLFLMSCYITHMARGSSGRLVFEVDPLLKRELHARVAREGRTLKDWLVEQIEGYLAKPLQESLPFSPTRGPHDE